MNVRAVHWAAAQLSSRRGCVAGGRSLWPCESCLGTVWRACFVLCVVGGLCMQSHDCTPHADACLGTTAAPILHPAWCWCYGPLAASTLLPVLCLQHSHAAEGGMLWGGEGLATRRHLLLFSVHTFTMSSTYMPCYARTYRPSPVNCICTWCETCSLTNHSRCSWAVPDVLRGMCGVVARCGRRCLIGCVPPAYPTDGTRDGPIAFTAEAGEELAKSHGVWRQERASLQRMHRAFPTTRVPGMCWWRGRKVCG